MPKIRKLIPKEAAIISSLRNFEGANIFNRQNPGKKPAIRITASLNIIGNIPLCNYFPIINDSIIILAQFLDDLNNNEISLYS